MVTTVVRVPDLWVPGEPRFIQTDAKRVVLQQLRAATLVHDWPRVDRLLDKLAGIVGHAG